MEDTMQLTTIGKPKQVNLKLCKKAIKWFGWKLLGPRLYDKVIISLEFDGSDMGSNIYGFCDWNDTNIRSRDFTISIHPKLSKKDTLLAIAHEMTHVKQYAKGELRDYMRLNRIKWKGKVYDTDDIDYWDTPWEIEAHGRERGLYVQFLESMRNR